jgi:hypothetical protein
MAAADYPSNHQKSSVHSTSPSPGWRYRCPLLCGLCITLLTSCTLMPVPTQPESDSTQPVKSLPITLNGVEDDRARFRHAFCEVNRQAGKTLPDYRPCEDALSKYRDETTSFDGTLDRSNTLWIANIVVAPGPSWACAKNSVAEQALLQHVGDLGYRVTVAPTEGFASTQRNAQLINDHVFDESQMPGYSPIVLIGYSKGVPDILEALTRYPELSERVIAVISIAGAVGGSPLADNYFRRSLALQDKVPGSACKIEGKDLSHSFKTHVRREWLATHPLPSSVRYYSIVSLPKQDHISSALKSDYRRLSRIDSRNDGQLLYYDQILPNSKLLGFLNADHMTVSAPKPSSQALGDTYSAAEYAYPREVLLESILRYLEQDFARDNQASSG